MKLGDLERSIRLAAAAGRHPTLAAVTAGPTGLDAEFAKAVRTLRSRSGKAGKAGKADDPTKWA